MMNNTKIEKFSRLYNSLPNFLVLPTGTHSFLLMSQNLLCQNLKVEMTLISSGTHSLWSQSLGSFSLCPDSSRSSSSWLGIPG